VRRALDAALDAHARVVVAVSGGPDSTALAHLVTEARPDLAACVGHVRHGLRDDAEDAAVTAAHARALGLAYHERSVRVRPGGQGLEAAAREARYAALCRIARTVDARAIVVGHTADDQAETVLLNIARGTGLRGLAGMAPSRSGEADEVHGVRIVRPLLRLRRADVHAFVRGEGLRFVSDPTNSDPEQRRARARFELLPALAGLSGGGGDPVAALTRLADLARADADALDELAAAHARRIVVAWGPARAVRTDALGGLPGALASRVVRLLLRGVRGGAEVPALTVSAVLALRPGQAVHGPGGVWVTSGGGWVAAVPPDVAALPGRRLHAPGAVALPELGLVVRADHPASDPPLDPGVAHRPGEPAPRPLADGPPGTRGPAWAVLPGTDGPLVVRGPRPGDRFGAENLAEALGAAGVPRALRALLPVVADATGVVWVPGLEPPPAPASPAAGEPGARVRLWLAPA